MKKFILLMLCLPCFAGFAQEKKNVTYAESKRKSSETTFYLGGSTGINQNTGLLGFNMSYLPIENTSFDMGLGLSTWGWKFNIGAKYLFPKIRNGRFAIGAGFTHSTGESNTPMNLETVYGTTETMTFDLKPVNAVHAEFYKMWYLGKKGNLIYIDLGYSAAITDKYIIQTSGNEASSNTINAINLISPGGAMLGFGFMFAIDGK